jgi:hypothetical protein
MKINFLFKRSLVLFIVGWSCGLKAGISVMGGLTYEKEAVPGETYRGVFQIANTGEEKERVKIYQTDYTFNHEGLSNYGDPGMLPRSNANWIQFSPKEFEVPAKENVIVNYEVHVPPVDTLAGTYWSMMMVQSIPEITPESMPQRSVGITTVMRYGVQMITHIGESGKRQLQFLDTKLIREQDSRFLQIDIVNTGERLLRPNVWVELYNLEGKNKGTFDGGSYRIYPETSVRYKIQLNGVAKGTYKALIVADCGHEDLFGVQYTVEIKE